MEDPEESTRQYWPLPLPAVALAAALAWWVIGFLPWLMSGMSDPTQIADEPNVPSRIGVPLYVGSLTLLVICALVGGVCAGLTTLLADGQRVNAALAAFAGTATAVTLVLLQSAMEVREASVGSFAAETRVITGLFLTTAAASLVGWVLGALALVSRGARGLAVAVLAGAAVEWLGLLVMQLSDDPITDPNVSVALRWVAAAILVVALVLIGVRPIRRLLWWPFAIVVAWLTGLPMATATGYLTTMIRPGGDLGVTLDATWDVFWKASRPDVRPLASWIPAIVVAAVIAVAVEFRNRRRETAEVPAEA